MAEIRVERKRTSLLPWIFGILLLALVIWALAETMDNDTDDIDTTVSAIELIIEDVTTALAAC
ncbi:MAG TPA: hypothetical protein VN493_17950 [Thermoanaerobaculia bacterium]|nr:hypothetical protein [Thermoanaerobaculia bacterium]